MPLQGPHQRLLVDPHATALHPDLAWAYDFPTPALAPIAGLIAFYNERIDITLDGELLERPATHFFK